MKIIKNQLPHKELPYPLEKIATPEKTLFLDIETTGLHARSTSLYLIGCVYFLEDSWNTIQWFSENYDEEIRVLQAFCDFAKKYHYIIHFNGNTFDIPYFEEKIRQYHLNFSFSNFTGIDLYRRIAPYKHFLKLPDCKQQTIEHFCNDSRTDITHGGDLIPLYHEYVLDQDQDKLSILLDHNYSDICGLLDICAVLAIPDLLQEPLKVIKVQANYYQDINHHQFPEIIMDLKLQIPLPAPISYASLGCYFSGEGKEAHLRVPIYEEELKYFYSNYKEYYYLPTEDMAIHKSVAVYTDKEYREQAHAYNCYTRKFSSYLPQWDILFSPFFKRDYKDSALFFELTDEFKKQRESFNLYAHHVLQAMVAHKP